LFGIHINHYKLLIDYLGNDQPWYFLRYGLAAQTSESDQEAIIPERIEDLAAHFRQEIEKLYPQGPYCLMGVSFGGLVAYEIAQQLVSAGKKVPLLIIFDTRLRFNKKRRQLGEIITQLRNLNFVQLQEKVKGRITNTFLSWDKSKAEVVQKTINYQPYEAKPYEGNVIFFKAMESPSLIFYSQEPSEEGWKKLIKGRLDVYEIPGDHLGILTEANNAKMVAEILEAIITKTLK